MKGAIIVYPGSPTAALQEATGQEIYITHDGFDVGKIHSTSAERRMFQYSQKTMVVLDKPENLLFNIAEMVGMSFEEIVTSRTHGIPKLQDFLVLWAQVVKEKQIPAISLLSWRFGGGVKIIQDYFGVQITAPTLPITKPTWSPAQIAYIRTVLNPLYTETLVCGNHFLAMQNAFLG